jgi:PmbA protein
MLGPQRMQKIIHHVLGQSTAHQTEVVLSAQETALTRFANSHIHQNVAERNVEVRVRAVFGKRVGVASGNDIAASELDRITDRAAEIALLQPENPDFLSLPAPQAIRPLTAFVPATADCTPNQRAAAVATICQLARASGLTAAGSFSTSSSELAVGNSLGVFAYAPCTQGELTTVVMSDDSSGYANYTTPDVRTVQPEELGREAVNKALRSRNPRPVAPGEYPVILEPYAVDTLLSYLSYLGFGALSVQEGRSFMAGKFGQALTGDKISIWDDGQDQTGFPTAFDFEGMPKKRVNLITAGVARGVVHDSYTANKEGKASTGHALPAPNAYGPLPGNLFLQPGQASTEQMLKEIDRGLWVTRFHYVNPVHPLKTILTGLTRDGTFWVQNGEIQHGTKNLRFTQNLLEALCSVQMISKETRLSGGFFGAVRAPALCLGRFAFTGATEF